MLLTQATWQKGFGDEAFTKGLPGSQAEIDRFNTRSGVLMEEMGLIVAQHMVKTTDH